MASEMFMVAKGKQENPCPQCNFICHVKFRVRQQSNSAHSLLLKGRLPMACSSCKNQVTNVVTVVGSNYLHHEYCPGVGKIDCLPDATQSILLGIIKRRLAKVKAISALQEEGLWSGEADLKAQLLCEAHQAMKELKEISAKEADALLKEVRKKLGQMNSTA